MDTATGMAAGTEVGVGVRVGRERGVGAAIDAERAAEVGACEAEGIEDRTGVGRPSPQATIARARTARQAGDTIVRDILVILLIVTDSWP